MGMLIQQIHEVLTSNQDDGSLDVAWDDSDERVLGTCVEMDWEEAADMGATHIIRVTWGCGRGFRREHVVDHLRLGVATIETGHGGVAGIDVVYAL